MKPKNETIQIVAMEPKGLLMLSEGRPGLHRMQDIGAGFMPWIWNG
ncbi:hypothetical protein [Butyricicoccus sp.]